MKEDLSDCGPDGNLLLHFSYRENGVEKFQEVITSVDVILFDSLYRVANWERITEELLQEQSIRMTVDPGRYYIVCWGNSGENTSFSDLSDVRSLSDCYVITSGSTTGDPLFYAPAEVGVKKGRQQEETLSFVRSHRTLHVYVEGMKDVYNGVNLLPHLQTANVHGKYDFLMSLQTDLLINYEADTYLIEKEGKEMAYTPFYLPHFPAENDIEIQLIKNSDNSVVTNLRLDEYLAQYTPEDEYNIYIHIGFFSGDIEITMPGWSTSDDVTPGW